MTDYGALYRKMERAADRADRSSVAFQKVLTEDENTDVPVEVGTVPSMSKRIKEHLPDVVKEQLPDVVEGEIDRLAEAADVAVQASADAVQASGQAEDARDQAESHAAEAAGSASSAGTSKTDAELARGAAEQARDEAIAAAEAAGNVVFAKTYADAESRLPLPDGIAVEVDQDETRDGARTRYIVEGDALVFAIYLDQLKRDLANPDKGAAMVAYQGGSVADKLDEIVTGAVTEPIVDAKVLAHDHDPAAHPELSAFISGEAGRAEAAADAAQAAADAAFINADVYPDVASGLAAVADGDQFQVASGKYLIRYSRTNASTAVEVARLANGDFVAEFAGSASDLFRFSSVNTYQGADLPVRRYTAAGVFDDYAHGYGQSPVAGGVRVSIMAQGTAGVRHYLRTRDYGGPEAIIQAAYENITTIAYAGVGLGWIDEFGAYRAYIYTSSGNLNRISDGYTVTNLQVGLPTFSSGDDVRIEVENGRLAVTVNDTGITTLALDETDFTGQLLAAQSGFLDFTFSMAISGDPVRQYLDDRVANLGEDLVTSSQLRQDAADLFRTGGENLFPEANLTVRRYTGASSFNDYPAGYSQTSTPEGLRVDIPSAGSATIKHFVRTGVAGAPVMSLRSTVGELYSDTQSVGIGYITSGGQYFGYVLSSSGNLHLLNGFSSTLLESGLGTYSSGDEVVIDISDGTLEAYVNGARWVTYELPSGAFDGEVLFAQAGFLEYTAALTAAADPIRSYVRQQMDAVTPMPEAFWEYNGSDTYHAYTRLSGDHYVGFRIARQYNMNELVYVDYWRIHDADFYTYSGERMVPTGVKALIEGESECVYKRSAAKDDFTGGVHGDELTERVDFFVDGVRVAPIGAVPLTPCTRFEYLVASTMHETAEGGVPIPGHPVECLHIKRTRIADGGYETFNRLVWERPGLVTLWYHGISCIAKSAATDGYSDDSFQPVAFTQSGNNLLESVGYREFVAWSGAYSASATSRQLKPSAADSSSVMFVHDRNQDSKYYRRSAAATVEVGDVWESVMSVKFGAQ